MEASSYFETQARECRKLAEATDYHRDKGALLSLARHYDREAVRAVTDTAAKREPRH